MTGRLPDAAPAVVIADGTSAGVMSQVIADALADLAVSRWLIPNPSDTRPAVRAGPPRLPCRERRAGTGTRRRPVRYRDLDRIDLDAAKEKVRQWMLAHPGGTPDQMAADLQGGYPQFPEHMAVVLRGLMAAFQDRPGELDPGGTSGETR